MGGVSSDVVPSSVRYGELQVKRIRMIPSGYLVNGFLSKIRFLSKMGPIPPPSPWLLPRSRLLRVPAARVGLTFLRIDKSRHAPGAFADGGSLVGVKTGHQPNFCSTRPHACYSLR